MRKLIRNLSVACMWGMVHHSMCGFVLLGAKKAVLPVTADAPTALFQWDGKAPTINKKDKYREGVYADLDDAQMMERLLADAMDIWNAVPGAFVVLAVAEATEVVKVDQLDARNVVVVESSGNVTSAAYAQPVRDAAGTTITDCDIVVANNAVAAESLVATLTHELGHCLGLGHAHSNYNAIMGYSGSRRDLRLGADDIAGAVYLYPDPKYGDGVPKSKVCGVAGAAGREPGPAAWLLVLPLLLAVGRALQNRFVFIAARAKAPQ